jgi:23S rRNA G2069 N7-methylase RlmK/C1962 C5-methylase RlmI
MLAWLPDQIIFGFPKIIDICIVSGQSVAAARDNHYHNPPDYLVLEPEDTTARMRNLQQTNTNGYKWQGTSEKCKEAEVLVESWGADGRIYKPTTEYQRLLRQLLNRYSYRLDTNFAKMDRIVHNDIEEFKHRVYGTKMYGLTILQWNRLISSGTDDAIRQALAERFGIREEGIGELLA